MKKPLFIAFYLFVYSLSFAQDVPQSQQSLMLGILNEFDLSINKLEANTKNSNQIISDLQKKTNGMSITTEIQQRQLNQALESLQASERTAQEKFRNYESSYQSLETSYKASVAQNRENEKKITALEVKLTTRNKIILGLSIGLAVAIALIFLVWRFKK